MGLIHSRASKKRAKAEAKLADEQARLIREQRRQLMDDRKADEHDERVEAAGESILRQPAVRDAINAARRKRSGNSH